MKKLFVSLIAMLLISGSQAQNVGIGTTTPHPSSILEIKDTTKGMLIPRMPMQKRMAIQSPAVGLMVYQTDSTKGFWYYDGTTWKNFNASPNYGGKHTIVLSDTITNAQAIEKLNLEFGPNTQELRIQGCLYLTTIDLSRFTTATAITITDNPVLFSVNLSNLKICEGYLSFNNCPLLNNINLNSLEKILLYSSGAFAALYVSKIRVATLNFPKLTRVLGVINILENPGLTSVNFPVLSHELAGLGVAANYSVVNISFPLLPAIGMMQFSRNYSLTSLSFPSVTKFTASSPFYSYATRISNSPNLTSIILGNLSAYANSMFETTEGTKLSSASVNELLHKFVSIVPPVSGKTISLRQQPPAPPTGQGIIDKASLIASGNTVYTD